MKSSSLYERLGGSSGISNLVEDIVALYMENSTSGPAVSGNAGKARGQQGASAHVP